MDDDVTMAGRFHWLTESEGGRTRPHPGGRYAATAYEESRGVELWSIVFDDVPPSGDEALAHARWLVWENVPFTVKAGTRLIITEGPRQVAVLDVQTVHHEPVLVWEALSDTEYKQVWDRFYEQFAFRPSIRAAMWPGITEPVPSLTWDLAVGWSRSDAWPLKRFTADSDEVGRVVLAALRECTTRHEWIYALDWQHPGYRFRPHGVDDTASTDEWPIPVFPDRDYYSFLAANLSFGVFGHPWEATLCVFGERLLGAVEQHNDGVLTRPYRRDGKPA